MKNTSLVLQCPFYEGDCKFPNFTSDNFVGCKETHYEFGEEVIDWVCSKFPLDMSITDVREAFMRMSKGK